MKKIALNILMIAGGLTIGYVLSPKHDKAYEESLEAQAMQARKNEQQARERMYGEIARSTKYLQREALYKDTLKDVRSRSIKYVKVYENIGHTSAPQYSNTELDSLISSIIR